MVLILTESVDMHADIVIDALAKRGFDHVRFETAKFPRAVVGSFVTNNSFSDFTLLTESGRTVHIDEIRTVWNRRPKAPDTSNASSNYERDFIKAESLHFITGFYHLLEGCNWVNPFAAERLACFKPYQLEVAKRHGFVIPRTLMSNSPDAVLAFAEQMGGEIIYKPFTSFSRPIGTTLYALYANKITSRDIQQRLDDIATCPGIFQEYIEKAVEIRATLIGDEMFATEIHSQDDPQTSVDWRRYKEGTKHRAHRLPVAVEAQLRKMVASLGLVFGCFDLILTPEGQYVFLELNPNGQWYWLESYYNDGRMLEAFVHLLTDPEYARTRRLAQDPAAMALD